jgi:prepilin-type N-terminal cleavage/methylation domain-containing protein
MLRRRAFTLIELLVVIAIIAILAAILFPVFAQARATAKKTACTSNMKQILIASQMYADDWSSTLASGRTNSLPDDWSIEVLWTRTLQPYMRSKDVFLCPAATRTHYADLARGDKWNNYGWLSIGYNSSLSAEACC